MTIEHPQPAFARRWIQLRAIILSFAPLISTLTGYAQEKTEKAQSKSETKDQKSNPDDAIATPPPQEIELAQIDHHRQLLEASLNPLKSAISKLDELALAYARSRNYEAAISARVERDQVVTALDRIAKELLLLETKKQVLEATLLPDHIILTLESARLEGVQLDAANKVLTRWERPGAYAEWTLPRIPPGGYEIVLTYQCSPLEGGTMVINERTFALSAEMDTTLRGPEVKNLGTLKITEGSGSLRLTARTIVKNNLMDLIAVELLPANR